MRLFFCLTSTLLVYSIRAVVTIYEVSMIDTNTFHFRVRTACGQAQVIVDRLYAKVHAGKGEFLRYCQREVLVEALARLFPNLFEAQYGFFVKLSPATEEKATHKLFPNTGNGREMFSVSVETIPHLWLLYRHDGVIIDVLPPGCEPAYTYPIALPSSDRPAYIKDRKMFGVLKGEVAKPELIQELYAFLEESCKDMTSVFITE